MPCATMYDRKVLHIILQEPVTYKTVSQIPYFTHAQVHKHTIDTNLYKHLHMYRYMATHEKFSSPKAKIYGIIFQEHYSIFSFIYIKKCGF